MTLRSAQPDTQTLLHVRQTLYAADLARYHRLPFALPKGTTRLELTLKYEADEGRIYPLLLGPSGFRGFTMARPGRGAREVKLVLASDGATPGALAGPLEAGAWTLVLDPMGLAAPTPLEVRLEASAAPRASVSAPPYPTGVVLNPAAGWYRGELHAHTHHSDGQDTTAELVAAAKRYGLDFLALTDHFTTSGWPELAELVGEPVALIRGLELTTHQGHANLLGIERWVDVLVDDPARSIDEVVRETHAAGGLFCVNHPFSGTLGWQRHDLDWAGVDLIEVYHHLEQQHNTLQLGLWDSLLNRGYRITGVGATDTHNASSGRHRLGQALTCVYCDELSERGVIAGLRRGRVYTTLGPELGFYAEQGGVRCEMGETLALGAPLTLHVEVSNLDRPATLYVLKNGLYHAHVALSPGSSAYAFNDSPAAPAYYRLELHARAHPAAAAHRYRAWDTFLAASNPIFAGAHFEGGRWKPV